MSALAAHTPSRLMHLLAEADEPLRLRFERRKRKGTAGEEDLQALAEAKTRAMPSLAHC